MEKQKKRTAVVDFFFDKNAKSDEIFEKCEKLGMEYFDENAFLKISGFHYPRVIFISDDKWTETWKDVQARTFVDLHRNMIQLSLHIFLFGGKKEIFSLCIHNCFCTTG